MPFDGTLTEQQVRCYQLADFIEKSETFEVAWGHIITDYKTGLRIRTGPHLTIAECAWRLANVIAEISGHKIDVGESEFDFLARIIRNAGS